MDAQGLPLAAGALAVALVYGIARKFARPELPLPPGPPTSWFGGVQLPKTYQWHVYAQWKEIYGANPPLASNLTTELNWSAIGAGDLIYVHPYGNAILVLNSAEACQDLLEKRSGIYSSRPVRTMVNDL